jgi:hypothetical protein
MRVTGMDRRVSAGWRAGLDYGQRVCGSGELRRRTAHSGDERPTNDGVEQCTGDERGVLEREANSSREEWGGSAAFYRERERKSLPGSLNGALLPSWPSHVSY